MTKFLRPASCDNYPVCSLTLSAHIHPSLKKGNFRVSLSAAPPSLRGGILECHFGAIPPLLNLVLEITTLRHCEEPKVTRQSSALSSCKVIACNSPST